MKARKVAGEVAKRLPLSKGYLEKKMLRDITLKQKNELIGLRQSVERLEARNEEWASEVRKLRLENRPKPLKIIWPVKEHDLIQADWTQNLPKRKTETESVKPPYKISWVVPLMGESSGGHTSIFRVIQYLEKQGHKCEIYIYDALDESNLEAVKANARNNYPNVKASIYYNKKEIEDCDVLFATNWFTAYPVFNHKGKAKKFYFVQDFEPYFEPVGTYSTLADSTYKFNLRGITLGNWLSSKLSQSYDMKCYPIELGVDLNEYNITNQGERKKILFYARPVTPRRGFELGILALRIFHEAHPEYEINFIGWNTKDYIIPFPYVNNGILKTNKLNELYNQSAAGLVLSYTNMSLLPLELMASGCAPVVNDSPHTRMATYAEGIEFAESQPEVIANKLFNAALNNSNSKNANKIAEYAKNYTWADSFRKLEEHIVSELS